MPHLQAKLEGWFDSLKLSKYLFTKLIRLVIIRMKSVLQEVTHHYDLALDNRDISSILIRCFSIAATSSNLSQIEFNEKKSCCYSFLSTVLARRKTWYLSHQWWFLSSTFLFLARKKLVLANELIDISMRSFKLTLKCQSWRLSALQDDWVSSRRRQIIQMSKTR
jgi:hypothetical protein